MKRSVLLATAACLALPGCATMQSAAPTSPARPEAGGAPLSAAGAAVELSARAALLGAQASALEAQASAQTAQAMAQTEAQTAAQAAALGASGYRMFETLRAKAPREDNTFIAPLSIQQAIGLVYSGARGATAAQIEALLGLSAGPAFDRALAAQRLAVTGTAGETRVKLANALWLKRNFAFAPAYLAKVRFTYDATVDQLDFADAPVAAANRINGWARDKTEGLITDVVQPDGFDETTLAVLTNALFFEGKWKVAFAQAIPQPFLFGDGVRREVPLMTKTARYAYAEAGGWQAVRLPYDSEGRFAMDVFLPLQRDPAAVLPAATFARLTAALDQAAPQSVVVTIPRFDIAWKATLNETLQDLGMRDAFSASLADLSGMVSPPSRNLVISKVSHLTRLQVFEEGTRAAAVTAVEIVLTSAPAQPPRQFRADQPFHLAIRERGGHLLFVGRIARPGA